MGLLLDDAPNKVVGQKELHNIPLPGDMRRLQIVISNEAQSCHRYAGHRRSARPKGTSCWKLGVFLISRQVSLYMFSGGFRHGKIIFCAKREATRSKKSSSTFELDSCPFLPSSMTPLRAQSPQSACLPPPSRLTASRRKNELGTETLLLGYRLCKRDNGSI